MHLHAEVFSIRRAAGKLKYLAGSESGAEVWINDISPEGAAAAYCRPAAPMRAFSPAASRYRCRRAGEICHPPRPDFHLI